MIDRSEMLEIATKYYDELQNMSGNIARLVDEVSDAQPRLHKAVFGIDAPDSTDEKLHVYHINMDHVLYYEEFGHTGGNNEFFTDGGTLHFVNGSQLKINANDSSNITYFFAPMQ